MRIVFVGAIRFSRLCLEAVLENRGDVVGVVTIAQGKSQNHSDYADLSILAADRQIPIYEVTDINEPRNVEFIKELRPDVIFVFGWSQIISPQILNIPPLGCIGTHPALLPRNRGRHPIVWVLVEGQKETGLTFFYLEDKADTGDILWQKSFPISLEDNAQTVYEEVESLATEAIEEFLPQLERGSAPRLPQDHSKATYGRKRNEKDGEICWSSSTMTVYNLIRALTHPYVGAHTYASGQRVKLWQAVLQQQYLAQDVSQVEPGIVFAATSTGFDIKTGDGHLSVTSYAHEGDEPIEIGARLGAKD